MKIFGMKNAFIEIETITDLHRFYDYAKPRHPLVSFIDLNEISTKNFHEGETNYRLGFYSVHLKGFKGQMRYGKSHYDFDEGALVFTAPNQVVTTSKDMVDTEGWGLFFHPDLLNRSELGKKIKNYSFFYYEANESLHISDEEKTIIRNCAENIKREYSLNIDKHTNDLILNNIELFLNYCSRFYNRQFLTRAKTNNDLVQRFESLLFEYFSHETLIETGLPDVKYFASALYLSPNYLSDLLNKYTGKTTQEHIHLQLVDKAKSLLWSSEKSISEIAYDLGFEHPSHFTKIFKAKTGTSPSDFRGLN